MFRPVSNIDRIYKLLMCFIRLKNFRIFIPFLVMYPEQVTLCHYLALDHSEDKTYQSSMLPLSSGRIPPKLWCPTTTPHGVTTQKTST
jgi:hypothetical protein